MSACSGKFVLRAGPELHRRLRAAAEERGLSLNEYCVQALSTSGPDPLATGPLPAGLLGRLKRHLPVRAAVLFGSAARGERRASSDVDLLVVVEGERALDRELYETADRALRDLAPRELSLHFAHLPAHSAQVGSLWLEVALDGLILEDADGETGRRLREIRDDILGGRWVRKLSHGQPYWVRGS
jgi:predicted nucleotidyltransferase